MARFYSSLQRERLFSGESRECVPDDVIRSLRLYGPLHMETRCVNKEGFRRQNRVVKKKKHKKHYDLLLGAVSLCWS